MHRYITAIIIVCLGEVTGGWLLPVSAWGLSVTATRVGADGQPVATGGVLIPAIRGPGERTLTYWINLKSFCGRQTTDVSTCPKADSVALSLEAAAKDWVEACASCKISIRRVSSYKGATFQVKYVSKILIRGGDNKGVAPRYIARAFYPRSKPEPVDQAGYPKHALRVSPKYFWTFLHIDQVGVFRHELGHILGYVHESSKPCKWESDTLPPGLSRLAVGGADGASIMVCGSGVSSDQNSLTLSPKDIADHQRVYGATGMSAK